MRISHSELPCAPTCISFTHTGAFIAIGFEDGGIGVLDLETQRLVLSENVSPSLTKLSWITWMKFDTTNDQDSENNGDFHYDLVKRVGMHPLNEVTSKTRDQERYSLGHRATESLLISFTVDFLLRGHIFGISHVFSVKLNNILTPLSIQASANNVNGFISLTWKEKSSFYSYPSLCLKSSRVIEHASLLLLRIHEDLNIINDAFITFGKRWKDATKVILPKLQLLHGILESYELSFTAVEFMFSIGQCGQWHPAASSFSNHWNEQGINRLRGSVESTLQSMIKSIQMNIIPTIMNIILSSR